MPSNVHLTTPLLLTCTAILAIMDVILALLAWRLISREQFTRMRWWLAIVGGVFFLLVWISGFGGAGCGSIVTSSQDGLVTGFPSYLG